MSKSSKSAKSPAAKSGIRFALKDAYRPGSGSALASYTVAWLALSGMDDGALLPAKVVRKIAGETAFGYHTRNGNFERTPDGIKLSETGFAHFGNMGANRNIRPDPEMVKAYTETLSSGKTNAMVKNAAAIEPLNPPAPKASK